MTRSPDPRRLSPCPPVASFPTSSLPPSWPALSLRSTPTPTADPYTRNPSGSATRRPPTPGPSTITVERSRGNQFLQPLVGQRCMGKAKPFELPQAAQVLQTRTFHLLALKVQVREPAQS